MKFEDGICAPSITLLDYLNANLYLKNTKDILLDSIMLNFTNTNKEYKWIALDTLGSIWFRDELLRWLKQYPLGTDRDIVFVISAYSIIFINYKGSYHLCCNPFTGIICILWDEEIGTLWPMVTNVLPSATKYVLFRYIYFPSAS